MQTGALEMRYMLIVPLLFLMNCAQQSEEGRNFTTNTNAVKANDGQGRPFWIIECSNSLADCYTRAAKVCPRGFEEKILGNTGSAVTTQQIGVFNTRVTLQAYCRQ